MRTPATCILTIVAVLLFGLTTLCQAASISGTVTNTTGKTGRIYIKAAPIGWGGDWSYGISIPSAGAFIINSLPETLDGHNPATYEVSTFVDVQGAGVQHANDPTVTIGSPVTIGSTSANLTLALPSPVAPQANEIIAYQGNGGNTVIWKPYEADNGLPIADKYVVSWNTSASDSGATTQEVYSGENSYMFFHNGGSTSLYYKVTAYVGATTASTGWVPVTTRSTGVTVSGSVTLSGVSSSKPLIVLLKQEVEGSYPLFYSAIIPTPSTSEENSYSISNVPAGTYTFHTFLDVNQDGVHGPGDLDYQPGIYASEQVVVSGSPVTIPVKTITQQNAFATLRTNIWTYNGATPSKNLGFTVEGQAKQPVNITVSGSGLLDNTPIGLGYDREFRIWPGLSTTPVTGGTYTYTVYYSDNPGDYDQFSVVVPAFLTSFATPLSPIGTVSYTDGIPTFSWSAPASPPSPYHYNLWLTGSDADWNTDDFPSTQTSILYNADGGASKTSLTEGIPYSWTIVAVDRYGNQAAYNTSFTMSSSSSISFTGTTQTPAGPSALPGVTITQDGSANSTSSGVDGSFTLNNLPTGTPFRLVMTYPGLVPVYTQYFTSASNLDLSNIPYYFLTQENLGLTTGKGAIVATFVDSSNGQALSGVTATAPGYTVLYLKSDVGTWDGTATDESGIIKILNVTPDTNVTITPVKSGYTFSQQTFSVSTNSVLEAGVFGTATPTISFTGRSVVAGVGTALSDVTIMQVDPSNNNTPTGNSTTSGADGSFTLNNLPISTYFRLLMTHPSGSYMPVYSQRFNSASNINNSNYPYFFVTVGSIPDLQSDKGVIFARLIDSSNGSQLIGATATVTAGYTVQYRNLAAGDWSGTATDSSGLIRVVNVPPYTNISLTPVKSGYIFNGSPYSVATFAADSVSEINLYGTPPPAPTITDFTGSGKIGDTITITGTNFVIGATTVSFNGTPSSTVNVSSATSLTAVVPNGATSGTISVTTAGGTATSGGSFTVTVDRTLTVSLASDTYGTGKVTVTGKDDCTVSPCNYTFTHGTVVDLTAVPDTPSAFVVWTGGVCTDPNATVCSVTMDADKSYTANFSLKQVKNETKIIYYSTLLEALTAADSGNEIRAHDSLQAPSLSYNRGGITIKIAGGYNNAFDQRNLPSMTYTDIASPLTIQSGTLILDQIIVK